MNTRPAGALLLLPFSVFCLAAAACAADPSGPGAAPGLRRTAAVDSGTTCSDSVAAGYGSCCTGGLEYEEFEYESETGTEYVATCDTTP